MRRVAFVPSRRTRPDTTPSSRVRANTAPTSSTSPPRRRSNGPSSNAITLVMGGGTDMLGSILAGLAVGRAHGKLEHPQMIPISDDNPTLRTPIVTILILLTLGAVWVFVQGAGLNADALAASVCNLGMVPGEITHKARLGLRVPLGEGVYCVVDNEPINVLTPLTSMFLHGGWAHILGNSLYLWVFGNNVEDSMGRFRFLVFYLLCGFAAAAAQIAINPASPVPMVGASGAIAGIMGAYLVLYPRVRVRVLFIIVIFIQIISVPAYLVLILWIATQVFSGWSQLSPLRPDVSSGVAVWAHIGGFAAGLILVKLFENRALVEARVTATRRRRGII
jgi:membrane associated rhomboid family serine protease